MFYVRSNFMFLRNCYDSPNLFLSETKLGPRRDASKTSSSLFHLLIYFFKNR